MYDVDAFERQVAGEALRMAGPSEPVDDPAIFTAINATQSRTWRFRTMFNATKFVVAGAILALFGSFLLAGVVTEPAREVPSAAAPGLGVAVSGTFGGLWPSPEPSSVYKSGGFVVGSYDLDGVPTDFDDDRLDGIMIGRADTAFYGPDVAVLEGPITITNENGAWSGDIRGAGVTAGDWVVVIRLDGSGAYAGLSATLIPNADGSVPGSAAGVIYASDDLDPNQRPEATTVAE
jgi:hypothetical protein